MNHRRRAGRANAAPRQVYVEIGRSAQHCAAPAHTLRAELHVLLVAVAAAAAAMAVEAPAVVISSDGGREAIGGLGGRGEGGGRGESGAAGGDPELGQSRLGPRTAREDAQTYHECEVDCDLARPGHARRPLLGRAGGGEADHRNVVDRVDAVHPAGPCVAAAKPGGDRQPKQGTLGYAINEQGRKGTVRTGGTGGFLASLRGARLAALPAKQPDQFAQVWSRVRSYLVGQHHLGAGRRMAIHFSIFVQFCRPVE